MEPHDLSEYLQLRAPSDLPWSQIVNLARIRRALGRPISLRGYEAICNALEAPEAQKRLDDK